MISLTSGFCLREYGFVSGSEDGPKKLVSLGERNASCRKGAEDYATRLLNGIGDPSHQGIERVLVVGDGIGDVRFADYLLETLRLQCRGVTLEGHFLGHPELNAAVMAREEFFSHPDWESLCRSIDFFLSQGRKTLVFVDIDRTIIYPRGIANEDYRALRRDTVFDFIQEFSNRTLDDIDLTKIAQILEDVVGSFAGYSKNENASIIFKNEETVACLALLKATGLINFRNYSLERLDENIRTGSRRAKQGGWISGLHRGFDDTDRIDGSKNWRALGLIQTFDNVLASMASNRPVFLPRFREVEASKLEEQLNDNTENLWNDLLLETLGRLKECSVVFLSDRPAVSLGEPDSPNEQAPSGFFAQELAQKLRAYQT